MREFRLRARVYFSDTDAGGIAYHRSYFDWAEHGRTEMLREAVPELPQSVLSDDGLLTVIKSIDIHYRMPAHLDDEIEIITSVSRIQRFSCIICQKITRDGDTLADLKVKAAFINKSTKHPVPVPDAFLKALGEGV